MKMTLRLIPLLLLFSACSPDENIQENPYLPELNFSFIIDLSLPEYNELRYPGNSFITRKYGLNGIVIYNLNNDQYLAFELSDPNHVLTECSELVVEGLEAACLCDDGNSYSIITGQPVSGEGLYSLRPYRIEKSGQVLRVWN